MNNKRQQVVQRLAELDKIKFVQPTARDLHSNRQGLSRVQRREMKRYEVAVKKQKIELVQRLKDLDRYLQKGKKIGVKGKETAQGALKKQVLVLGKKPVLKKTRLPRYQQRRRLR